MIPPSHGLCPAGCFGSALKEGWGRGMAPRGLGIRHEDGYRQWKRNATSRVPAIVCSPTGSRRCFTSWTPGRRRKGRAVRARSLVGQRPLLNGTHFSCRWLRSSIPTDLTARSHRPRAVEHRDCPPCGGDVGIITQVRRGGDGGLSIPQLAEVSGLIGLGLASRDSAESVAMPSSKMGETS